jgi:hypothetical protein
MTYGLCCIRIYSVGFDFFIWNTDINRNAIETVAVYTPTPPNSLWMPVHKVLPNDQTIKNINQRREQVTRVRRKENKSQPPQSHSKNR